MGFFPFEKNNPLGPFPRAQIEGFAKGQVFWVVFSIRGSGGLFIFFSKYNQKTQRRKKSGGDLILFFFKAPNLLKCLNFVLFL